MGKNDKSTSESSGETQSQTRMPVVSLYCLTKLSESEKASYQQKLVNEYCDVELIEWTHDTDGDMDDMYRIWEENKRNDDRGSYHFSFFLDRFGVKDISVIIAQPDVYTLCHTKEAWAWGQELMAKNPIPSLFMMLWEPMPRFAKMLVGEL
ncbi:hypothetical protein F5Y08DRAFT_297438 [Xylaria arbuscula]|nr:hypothetical protein F5Y08DRAFT_297438 [Xylaria arbuscula]